MAKRETQAERTARILRLVQDAIVKGFRWHQDDDGLWWVDQPARPRRPAISLGSHPNEERARMSAAHLAINFPAATKAVKR